MEKLVIVFSGKKQSGKSAACKFILSYYINQLLGVDRFSVINKNKSTYIHDSFDNSIIDIESDRNAVQTLESTYKTRVYSFADKLKQICIDVLGLDVRQCYGADRDKNTNTHITWDRMPPDIRQKYKRPRRGTGEVLEASGYMSGREIMQVIGSDFFRKLDNSCWARGTYNTIFNDSNKLICVSDARFPNEVTMGTERNAKVIRLLRNSSAKEDNHISETALDDFPLGEYSLVIDNKNLSMKETHNILKSYLDQWLKDYDIL
ncbi:MAG: hypothetical protein BAJALOKI3v1_50097 [Promethearchaeota archaeon]|nr:MAG: hypothetical protein BAJALOKI3v1_50097 [Candidatus Lokiarchaeota archaeon]